MEEKSILVVGDPILSGAIYTDLFQKTGFDETLKVYVAKDIEAGYKKYLEVNPSIIIENQSFRKEKFSFSKAIRLKNSSIPIIYYMSIGDYTGKENFKDYTAVVNIDKSGLDSMFFVVYKLSRILGVPGIWKEREDPKYREKLEKGNIPENYIIH